MSEGTRISWADNTWNPILGCTRVSPGCDRCYAIWQARMRAGNPHPVIAAAFAGLAVRDGGRLDWTGVVRLLPERLTQPLRVRKPRRWFVNSLSDLFHEDVPDEYIARVWQVMGAAPHHSYVILTKRHARMRSWVTRWYAGEIPEPYDVQPVQGFPGYSVTTHGEVLGKRSDTRGGLAQEAGEQGHRRVTMHREGSPRSGERELVHRLVLTAFARPPRPGEQGCHRNGDPSDNRLSNLYWGTQHDNWRDRLGHGNGQSHSKLTEDGVAAIRRRFGDGESAYSIARDFPVSDTQIRNIVRGDQWASAPAAARIEAPARVVLDCVWLGVSAENQKWADIRIPALLATPAAIRVVSAEPLLGPVDLHWCGGVDAIEKDWCGGPGGGTGAPHPLLDWVIVGGESGPGARECDVAWIRDLVRQCERAGTAVWVKQLGSVAGQVLGAGASGDDMAMFPADLQVRQIPRTDQVPV